jgi:hypothetical protein
LWPKGKQENSMVHGTSAFIGKGLRLFWQKSIYWHQNTFLLLGPLPLCHPCESSSQKDAKWSRGEIITIALKDLDIDNSITGYSYQSGI